jgi:hypothetical protein
MPTISCQRLHARTARAGETFLIAYAASSPDFILVKFRLVWPSSWHCCIKRYVIMRPQIFRSTFTPRPSDGRGDGLAGCNTNSPSAVVPGGGTLAT